MYLIGLFTPVKEECIMHPNETYYVIERLKVQKDIKKLRARFKKGTCLSGEGKR